jgi:hypothetical protein
MEFRLVYQGPLKASGNDSRRVPEKHAIRKVLHKQLAELWRIKYPMSAIIKQRIHIENAGKVDFDGSGLDALANDFSRCGFRFAPLVNRKYGTACGLDILFLRRENPGELITKGGDIDNRLKTLFDALRVPEQCSELGGATPDVDENPMFCLLESDTLITDFSVTTDRLLLPLKDAERDTDVHLVINVRVRLVSAEGYLDFAWH